MLQYQKSKCNTYNVHSVTLKTATLKPINDQLATFLTCRFIIQMLFIDYPRDRAIEIPILDTSDCIYIKSVRLTGHEYNKTSTMRPFKDYKTFPTCTSIVNTIIVVLKVEVTNRNYHQTEKWHTIQGKNTNSNIETISQSCLTNIISFNIINDK